MKTFEIFAYADYEGTRVYTFFQIIKDYKNP